MNNTFSLQQRSQTGNLDSRLILRQYKLDLMARFMKIKSVNSRLRQDQIAKEIRCSSSTLQRYGKDMKMLSACRNPPKSNKKGRRFQIVNMTSKDLK